MTDPAELRIGDAEREAASVELARHYAEGRLDAEEHSERLDRIWAARTRRELDPVFADLRPPTPYAVPWAARPAGGQRPARPRPRFPMPLVVLAIVLIVLTVATHLPLVLILLGAWLFLGRGRCGSGRRGGPRGARWS